eukprot:scaffold29785_cov51-Phaeocystis_antarctica.AAC.1
MSPLLQGRRIVALGGKTGNSNVLRRVGDIRGATQSDGGAARHRPRRHTRAVALYKRATHWRGATWRVMLPLDI